MKVNLIKLQRENLKVEKENVIQSSREKKSWFLKISTGVQKTIEEHCGAAGGKKWKGSERVNTGQILCACVYKWKNEKWDLLKLFQEWRVKENGGGGESSTVYLIYCKTFCKCHSVPYPAEQ
jgi:hypothetical protein